MHNFPVPNRRLRIFPLSQISVFCMTKSLRKPLTYRRRISPQSRYSIHEYASLTAETIWAWNRLHSTLLDLFSSLLEKGGTKRKEAYAIWHTIQSDSVQRTLLENVAEAALSEKSHKLKQIIWLLKSIGRIAAYRNATVHTPIVFQIIDIDLPAAIYLDYEGARKNSADRLQAAGVDQRFWDAIAGDLYVLGQFAAALTDDGKRAIDENGIVPSLRRPRLLSPQLLAEIDRQMSPQAKKAPKRQPRASAAKRAKP